MYSIVVVIQHISGERLADHGPLLSSRWPSRRLLEALNHVFTAQRVMEHLHGLERFITSKFSRLSICRKDSDPNRSHIGSTGTK